MKIAGSRATYFLEYNRPVAHTLVLNGRRYKVRAPQLQLSDKMQQARAKAVEKANVDPSFASCNGMSEIPRHLRYVSYNNLWLLPLAHTALNGVVKKVWGLALATYTSGA